MNLVFFLIGFQMTLFGQSDVVTISPCIDSCCNLLKSDGSIDLENRNSCNKRTIEQTIALNLKYPVAARNAGIEGLVFVSFQVNSLGQGENFRALNKIGGNCEQEAVRLAKLLFTEHQWQYPDTGDSEQFPVTYNVPIRFSLRD